MDSIVKQEITDKPIDLSDSDSDDDMPFKIIKDEFSTLPLGFLDPLPDVERMNSTAPATERGDKPCRQFWKAGDFDEGVCDGFSKGVAAAGMDHVRVHPKFLHSNATSHKWALGALAELLDNSLDEVCNGATYVNIDMLLNDKDGTQMLLIEDDGGGMDPDKMRQCMSLGYSVKYKLANTIGQYGNGFKTSTMRLGADVIVFSRSSGKSGKRSTRSIGMLSYSFLRGTRKEDIVVPMLDYEKREVWDKAPRSSLIDWDANLETIIKWSPYSSEHDLLKQFSSLKDQGTRVVIYNLWEDDQGELELDFETDKFDIQLRGVNRDEAKIEMAEHFPNSRHFLTYRHSLRSYASILYMRLPHSFRMVLRGKVIEHHNIVNDMMLKQELTYKPQPGGPDGVQRDPHMVAVVTIGFVKDAKDHIDVQGFNVYHKNRLIKPFWRVWNATGSDGRGVIGVLEANFVEPAHDKQDFERTTILSRLENKLIQMQKTYWSTNCHKIGYAPRRNKKLVYAAQECSPERLHFGKNKSTQVSNVGKPKDSNTNKPFTNSNYRSEKVDPTYYPRSKESTHATKPGKHFKPFFRRVHDTSDVSDNSDNEIEDVRVESSAHASTGPRSSLARKRSEKVKVSSPSSSPFADKCRTPGSHPSGDVAGITQVVTRTQSKVADVNMPAMTLKGSTDSTTTTFQESDLIIEQLKVENEELKESIKKVEATLQYERGSNKSLAEQLEEAKRKLEEANNEQDALAEIFSEETSRRDKDAENLRKKLKDASHTIQDLLEKRSFDRNK